MAANASLATARSYYDTTRVNAHVYVVGGNDGSGPTASVESILQ